MTGPVAVLLAISALGCLLLLVGRDGGVVQHVGATLALAGLLAIPVGHAMGTL